MHIRNLEVGEEPALWILFHDTIHNVNIGDYSSAEVDAWAPPGAAPANWAETIQGIRPFVVEAEQKIIGYSDLQADGLIDHLYVHHLWQRRGVGRMLLGEIKARAKQDGIMNLHTYASITARPFFEAFGFSVTSERTVELRGQRLKGFIMERRG